MTIYRIAVIEEYEGIVKDKFAMFYERALVIKAELEAGLDYYSSSEVIIQEVILDEDRK